MIFDASKQKGSSRYYIHPVGMADKPLPGTYGEKNRVLHDAAERNGMTYKEFMRARKEWRKGAES